MTMKVHPAAAVFPMISEDELKKLAEDIVTNGQIHPCVTWNGMLVDGRNRLAACEIAKVSPRFEEREFSSEDAVFAFILSSNEHRRHLSASQRAMIAAELANLRRGENEQDTGGLSVAKAAKAMKVSERAVTEAKKVQREAPALAKKVKSGEIKVHAAAEIAKDAEVAAKVESGEIEAKAAAKEVVAKAEKAAKPSKDVKELETLRKENEALQKKLDELTEKIQEMGNEMEALHAEAKSLQQIVDADDKVAAAAKLEKMARERERAMKSQLDGAMRAKNMAVAAAKAANTKIVALERKIAKLEDQKAPTKKAA